METLAYFDLTLAYEASTDAPPVVTLENLNCLEWLKLPKRSRYARMHLLSLLVILSILGMADEGIAQTIRQGNRGAEVTEVQQRLRELGYFNQQPTGYFGEITQQAVMRFQQENGLVPDGIVGRQTRATLFNTVESPLNQAVSLTTPPPATAVPAPRPSGVLPPPSSLGTLPPPRTLGTLQPPPPIPGALPPQSVTQTPSQRELRLGDRGSDVRQLQQTLRQRGFDPGPVDGVYGSQTQEAVRQFQRSHNLRVNGIADANTLAQLDLIRDVPGSERTRYVVVVPLRNQNTLSEVRAVVGFENAYLASSRRGRYVDAGRFSNRASAESRSYLLRSRGLDSRVAHF